MSADDTKSTESLKQLGFVPEYGSKGYQIASSAYENVKTRAPEPVKEQLSKVEQMTAPIVTKATDKGSEILKVVDTKVDQAVQTMHEQFEKQKQYHTQNLENYRIAREQYLKKVEEVVTFVKTKGITGTAKMAVDEVGVALVEARKIPGSVAKRVHDAFEKMMSMEAVQKVLKGTQPAVQMAYTRYQNVHDAVVASSSYKKIYDMSVSTMCQVQSSYIYRKAAENLYPLIARYADPALAQVAESDRYQALLTHVAPKATAVSQ